MAAKKEKMINTLTALAPWLVTLSVFWVYPLLYAFYLSFVKYHTLTDSSEIVGPANYYNLIGDPLFWKALWNTAIFTFGTVPFTALFSLILAVIMNDKLLKFRKFFRTSYFLPSVTSLVVISLIFTNLYSRDGYVNSLLAMMNLPHPGRGWLLEPSTALFSVMAMDVWMSVGYYMMIFLAGLQTIPDELYDAARLSGAKAYTRFTRITLPLIKPTLTFVLVINTIKSFQVFIEIFVMTKGGPLGSTTTLVYLVFTNAFEKADAMGYASAIAIVLFIILLILSIVQINLLKERKAA